FAQPLESVPVVRPGAHCDQIADLLRTTNATCAVVVDAGARPVGILTAGDVIRRAAFRVPPQTPVEAVMTAPVLTISRREYLYAAIAAMRRHAFRHLPVVDRDGRLVGLIRLHEALAAAAPALLRQIERLARDDTLDGIKDVKAAQVELAEELLAEELPATEIQQVLTRINNDLYRRVGEAALRAMAEEGWGDPPAAAATIVMGSGGRGENYLLPDQDNGFIIADYPDSEHTRIDTFYIELAERLCRILNDVGFPYCNGHCMAMNPLWRKTLRQWIEQISRWGQKSNFIAIRLSDIFFDFQPVWGNNKLAVELREAVSQLTRKNPFFLKQMFLEKTKHNVALGFLGGFITEKADRDHRGQIDLKYTGTIPLIGAIRLLALREGIQKTSTLERIYALREAGIFSANEYENLSAAFSLLTEILLKKQIVDFNASRRINYYVDLKTLSKRQRWLLLDAFRSINTLRNQIHYEFTAQLF
ncbi:MAG TPA: hypothetical protein DEP36_16665, partial [Gammaproteobacteria bacterium]|nr:hypothetical protein [Gammaproteobacteria bacterium]